MQCHREAKYLMRLTLHGEAEPRPVLLCATCDKNQGRKHLMALGWSLDEAIKWEKNPERTPSTSVLESRDGLTPSSIRSTTSASVASIRRTRAIINNTSY